MPSILYNAWPAPLWLIWLPAIVLIAWFLSQSDAWHALWSGVPAWLNELVEKQHSADGRFITNAGKPRWTYLLPATAGAIGGTFALITYIFSHRQREIQFDRGELEARFKDVQDRFASSDNKTRANAALRLADMGMTRGPGRPRTVTRHARPFFLRAGAQLAIALYMEEDTQVRAALAEALRTLVDFAAKRPGEDLLKALITKLVEANRTACETYVHALAEYSNSVPNVNSSEQENLLGIVSPFCSDKATNSTVLESLMRRSDYASHKAVHAQRRRQPIGAKERRDAYDEVLRNVEDRASRLINTRDVLGYALRALRARKRGSNLDLIDSFVVGADLPRVHLEGASLSGAYLGGG